jgi:soluble lytic murein transglycosylase-like protein
LVFRFSKTFAVVLLILAAQLSALAAEVAVLRNGFTIRHQRREQMGNITRLYTAEGYVDIPTEQIASFEVEETPPPQPEAVQQPPQVASVVPAAQPAALGTRVDLDQVVREASARRQLDPDFVTSVIKAESNFYPRAVSPKGAQGLMQLMPGTAAKLGVSDPFDPRANVEAGTTYLSELLDLYNNDPIRALAAYNAGPQRVQQYHGVPPYRETKLYIARIVHDFNAKKAKKKVPVMTAQAPQRKTGSVGATHKTASGKATTATKEQKASLSENRVPSATRARLEDRLGSSVHRVIEKTPTQPKSMP